MRRTLESILVLLAINTHCLSQEPRRPFTLRGTVTQIDTKTPNRDRDPCTDVLVIALPSQRISDKYLSLSPKEVMCSTNAFSTKIVGRLEGQSIDFLFDGNSGDAFTIHFPPYVANYSEFTLTRASPKVRAEFNERAEPTTIVADYSVPGKTCKIVTTSTPFSSTTDKLGRFEISMPAEFEGIISLIAFGADDAQGRLRVSSRASRMSIEGCDIELKATSSAETRSPVK